MSSRNLDLGLAASNGVTVLPDVTTLPALNQILAVTQGVAAPDCDMRAP